MRVFQRQKNCPPAPGWVEDTTATKISTRPPDACARARDAGRVVAGRICSCHCRRAAPEFLAVLLLDTALAVSSFRRAASSRACGFRRGLRTRVPAFLFSLSLFALGHRREDVAMAELRSAEAEEMLAPQFFSCRFPQLLLLWFPDPECVFLDHLAAVAVSADAEGVAPFGGPADVDADLAPPDPADCGSFLHLTLTDEHIAAIEVLRRIAASVITHGSPSKARSPRAWCPRWWCGVVLWRPDRLGLVSWAAWFGCSFAIFGPCIGPGFHPLEAGTDAGPGVAPMRSWMRGPVSTGSPWAPACVRRFVRAPPRGDVLFCDELAALCFGFLETLHVGFRDVLC